MISELVSALNSSCTTCMPHIEEGCYPAAEILIELMADSPPHDIPLLFVELIDVMKKCSEYDLESLRSRYVQSTRPGKCCTEDADESKKIDEKQYVKACLVVCVGYP